MEIFIITNSKLDTGGAESLHQLASKLKENGEMASIVYCDKNSIVPEKFAIYDFDLSQNVIDIDENIVIVPEIYSNFFHEIKHAKKIIWWLSFDYYLSESADEISKNLLKKYQLPSKLYKMVKLFGNITNGYGKYPKFSFYEPINLSSPDIVHYYNSEYVRLNLEKRNLPNVDNNYLCGPIADIFFENHSYDKEDIILYNPAKGKEKTEFLINQAKINGFNNFKFIPLENLKRPEIIQKMRNAKIYIDFGEFPGPERIPREAVLSHCLIVTSKEGAANNEKDVPISPKFKFKDVRSDYLEILNLLEDMIFNYDLYDKYFDKYRRAVTKQKTIFNNVNRSYFE